MPGNWHAGFGNRLTEKGLGYLAGCRLHSVRAGCLRRAITQHLEGLLPPRMAGLVFGKPIRPCTGDGWPGTSGCGPSGDCRWSRGGDATRVTAHGLVTVESGADSPPSSTTPASPTTPASTTWTTWACGSRSCEASPSPTATPTTTAASPAWSRGSDGRSCPCSSNPDGWLERKIVFPSYEVPVPPPTVNDLGREGVEVIEEKGPSCWSTALC